MAINKNYLAICPEEEKDNHRACSIIPTLVIAFLRAGSAAIIVSDTHNVAESFQAASESIPSLWLFAVTYRLQQKLYIFNPAFQMDTAPRLQLSNILDICNVRRLVMEMDKKDIRMKEIWITGIRDMEQQCLGLCCRWLERLATRRLQIEEEQ